MRQAGHHPGTVVVDRDEWDRLPAALELYRSALSLIHGDPAAAIAHADLATSIAADDDHLTRAGAAAMAGLARWAGGDLEEAHRSYSTSVEGLRQGRAHLRRAGLLHHAGRHPHHPRSAHRRAADLPGRAAPRRTTTRSR